MGEMRNEGSTSGVMSMSKHFILINGSRTNTSDGKAVK